MSQHPGHGPEDAVRTLLVTASEDGPPTPDLLHQVRQRAVGCREATSRRRRALVPSLATLGAAGVLAAVALVASAVTSTPPASAQTRVVAAATLTAQDSYRVRLTSTKRTDAHVSSGTDEGVFDPATRTGRLDGGKDVPEVRFVGDTVYTLLPANHVRRPPDMPERARWVASERGRPKGVGISELAEVSDRVLADPQQALEWVRSAGQVRERGTAAGAGWTGLSYALELTDRHWRITGTVDVDTDGRVRRLDLTIRASDRANGLSGTVHLVLEFWDFGTRERVTAPPADEVYRAPSLEEELEARRERVR
jgi:hypothetical protein